MTKPIKASEVGLKPHYKVRVVLPGALLHLAAWNEPDFGVATESDGWTVRADWIDDPAYGDTLGFIEWPEVKGLTWRYSE